MTDGYEIYYGDHTVRYTDVESLCCAPETAVILYVNYTLVENVSLIDIANQKYKSRAMVFLETNNWTYGHTRYN